MKKLFSILILVAALAILAPSLAFAQAVGGAVAVSGTGTGALAFHYLDGMTNDYLASPRLPAAYTIQGNPICLTDAGTATANIYQSDSPFTNVNGATLVGAISCTTSHAGATPSDATIESGKYIRVVFSSLSTAVEVFVTMVLQ